MRFPDIAKVMEHFCFKNYNCFQGVYVILSQEPNDDLL